MSTVLAPYITFPGTCREAMEFYRAVFEGSLEILTAEQTGMTNMPADALAHAELTTASFTLRGSDGADVAPTSSAYSLSIVSDDAEWIRSRFAALSAGASVTLPLAIAEWGDEFGELIDRFGVCWRLNVTAEH